MNREKGPLTRMKKALAIAMSFVLMVITVAPGVSPASLPMASDYAPTPPTGPTPIPTGAAPQTGTPTTHEPPSPDNLSPEVEEARARQAIEAVLDKYLRYWGPRYQAAISHVSVEGEWAYGVAQWQSEERTLQEGINLIARRSLDGTWQALMPSSEGLYLQWVEAVPAALIPTDKKVQLRAQAIETDAWTQYQTTREIQPTVVATPPAKNKTADVGEPILRLPESTPTPTPVTGQFQDPFTGQAFEAPLSQTPLTGQIYIDPLYHYRLKLAPDWHVSPTPSDALFGVAILYNYDPDEIEQRSILVTDSLKIQIGVGPLRQGQSFDEWVVQRIADETTSEYAFVNHLTASQLWSVQVSHYSGVAFILQGGASPPVLEIDLSHGNQVMSIGLLPADSSRLPEALAMLATLEMSIEETQQSQCEMCEEESPILEGRRTLSLNAISQLLSLANSPEDFTCPIGTFPGNEAPNSPIEIWMPFLAGETWTVGGAGAFYGNWYHCNYYNDYYATDWNRSGDDGAAVLPVANGTISDYDAPPCPTTGYGCFVQVDHV